MKTPMLNLKSIVEQKILDAQENNSCHWTGVVHGLRDILIDINQALALEKPQRTLYVKSTTIEELEKEWACPMPLVYRTRELFVRCNIKGEINWDKTLVYRASELINRKIVIIK